MTQDEKTKLAEDFKSLRKIAQAVHAQVQKQLAEEDVDGLLGADDPEDVLSAIEEAESLLDEATEHMRQIQYAMTAVVDAEEGTEGQNKMRQRTIERVLRTACHEGWPGAGSQTVVEVDQDEST